MFNTKPENRPTAAECLTHPWFNQLHENDEEQDAVISAEVLNGLQHFHGRNRLRRQCMLILVKMVNP